MADTQVPKFVEFISKDRTLPVISSLNTVIYIDKSYYINDLEVMAGLKSIKDTLKQLQKDITRCDFFCDGGLTTTIPVGLNKNVISFCTQASLGFPISLFHKNYSVVEQSPAKRMIVEVWGNTFVTVSKDLTLLGSDVPLDFKIMIKYNEHESNVQVDIIPGGGGLDH